VLRLAIKRSAKAIAPMRILEAESKLVNCEVVFEGALMIYHSLGLVGCSF